MSLKDINGFSPQNMSAIIHNSTSSETVGNVASDGHIWWNGGKLKLNVVGISGMYGSASFGFSASVPGNVSSTFPLAGNYYLKPEIV